MACLIMLKASLLSSFHLKIDSLFNKFRDGLGDFCKVRYEPSNEIDFTKERLDNFLTPNKGIFWMDSTHDGSIFTPSFELMWPKSFPSSTPKTNFLGFNEIPYFLHLSKTCLR
jgi:hypothetical protein